MEIKQNIIINMCTAYYADKNTAKHLPNRLVLNRLFNTQNGYVSRNVVLFLDKSFNLSTETMEGKELLYHLRDLINFNKTYLTCTTLGRYPLYSASIDYIAFCTHLSNCKIFNTMCYDLQIQDISNIESIHIGFKPLKQNKDVDLAWTTLEQYLNGEIGIKPDDR